MLGLFKSKKERPPLAGPASIGENRRVYAVGDIHGRIDLFMELMDAIARDDWRRKPRRETSLVLLGDYVDRGPNSREVIDFILKLKDQWADMTCLMGNHEQVFLMALNGDEQAVRFFIRDGVGGRETLMSYGATEEQLETLGATGLWEWMAEAVPQSHKDFLASLVSQLIIGDYAFVHAGILPGVPMAEQEETDLFWIREPFLNHEAAHPYMIIHGHSIREEVELRSNRIGIDTGAYATGRLTAVGLEGTEHWILDTASAKTAAN